MRKWDFSFFPNVSKLFFSPFDNLFVDQDSFCFVKKKKLVK